LSIERKMSSKKRGIDSDGVKSNNTVTDVAKKRANLALSGRYDIQNTTICGWYYKEYYR
jgi:hypothetical protein